MIIRDEMWQLSDIQQQLLITQISTNKFVFHYRQGRAGVLKDFGVKNTGRTLKQAEKILKSTALQLKQQGYKLVTQFDSSPVVRPMLLSQPQKLDFLLAQPLDDDNLLQIIRAQLKIPIDFQFLGNHIQEIEPLADNLDKRKVFGQLAARYYFYPIMALAAAPVGNLFLFFDQMQAGLIAAAVALLVIIVFFLFIRQKSLTFIANQTVEKLSLRHIYAVSGGVLYYFTFLLDNAENHKKNKPLRMKKLYLFHTDKVEKVQNGLILSESGENYELFLTVKNSNDLFKFIQQLKNDTIL